MLGAKSHSEELFSPKDVTCRNHIYIVMKGRHSKGLCPVRKSKVKISIFQTPVLEFKDPAFAKTSPKRSLSVIENERFWAYLRENWVYKFGH
jgi:hypothetical protein